jgi:hypothetical protein
MSRSISTTREIASNGDFPAESTETTGATHRQPGILAEMSGGQEVRRYEERDRRTHGDDHTTDQPSQQRQLDTSVDTNQYWRNEQWEQGGVSPEGMVDNVSRAQLECSGC